MILCEKGSIQIDPSDPQKGTIRELILVDQWSSKFFPLIKKYQTSSAICGYVSIASAYLLAGQFTSDSILTVDELNNKLKVLQDTNKVYKQVEKAMKFIYIDRMKYLEEYENEFSNERERSAYLSDWVANYEISDYMTAFPNKRIHFVRAIERNFEKVNHEEKRRLEEEIPFRNLDFFVDGAGQKTSPKDWKQMSWENVIFIVDMVGHFVVMKPVLLKMNQNIEKTLLLINSMKGDHLSRDMTKKVFHLWFDNTKIK